MVVSKIRNLFVGRKTYNNVIEAFYSTFLIRKMVGSAVMVTTLQRGNVIDRSFCPLGFLLFVFWNSIYLFCIYKVFNEDQAIVKNVFTATKLRSYGDDYERISGFIFGLFTMAINPFRLSGNKVFLQKVFDIDKVLKDNGETIDYNKIPIRSLVVICGQTSIYLFELICHWLFLESFDISLVEKVFINFYIDTQALTISWTFMYYTLILKDRFEIIKRALIRIRDENNWKFNVFHQNEVPKNLRKALHLSEKQICEKIRSCAKIYTMLCKSSCLLMKIVGLPVHVCFLVYKTYVILYIFYLVEATQLMFDLTRCIEFVLIVLWGLLICFSIIFLFTYFSEKTLKEVVHIRYVLHDIINENMSPSINKEAMQFSMQLLHEQPEFSVLGLYKLNYESMFEEIKTITTYLVILLQWVGNWT